MHHQPMLEVDVLHFVIVCFGGGVHRGHGCCD